MSIIGFTDQLDSSNFFVELEILERGIAMKKIEIRISLEELNDANSVVRDPCTNQSHSCGGGRIVAL